MTPDMQSLSGSLGGSLANSVIHTEQSKVLTALTSNVKFLDPSKINLNQKLNLTFDNGKVNIQPFVVKYQDIDIKIDGTHGFDQTMNYNVNFDVPAKYLGEQVTAKATALKVDISKISVPVTANITGNFQSPKVSTNIAKAITNVVTQLVNQEKDKYINQAKDKATEKGKELLGNLLGGNKNSSTTTTTKDTAKTTTPKTNEEVKKQAEDAAKNTVKNAVNGLFKKKDKKE
jgi:hypothetical protein